jgi:hypothetical protein
MGTQRLGMRSFVVAVGVVSPANSGNGIRKTNEIVKKNTALHLCCTLHRDIKAGFEASKASITMAEFSLFCEA